MTGEGWPGDWPELKVVYDEYCPVDTAFVINGQWVYTFVQMSKRTWWKPWTWRRHVLTMQERWDRD